MQRPRLLILCSRLDLPGGTERAIVNMANLFRGKGHVVTLLILDEATTDKVFYPLDPGIEKRQLLLHFGITKSGNLLSRKTALLQHVSLLRKEVKGLKPDMVIATDYVFAIAAVLARIKKTAKLVSWEPHHFHWLQRNRFWSFLFRKTYPLLDAVICLNQSEAALFSEAGCRTVVIPGFLPQFPQFKTPLHSKSLITVGWLSKRKGTDLIPAIAAAVFKAHPGWRWTIVGSGEEEGSLKKELEKGGLLAHFEFIPVTDHNNLQRLYRQASLYIMPSRQEGFPAVLLEAMANGVPAIAFDCPTGPSAIINHNTDGLLIPCEDTAAMIVAMDELMENEDKRKRLGAQAFINSRRFSADNIYELWFAVFSAGN